MSSSYLSWHFLTPRRLPGYRVGAYDIPGPERMTHRTCLVRDVVNVEVRLIVLASLASPRGPSHSAGCARAQDRDIIAPPRSRATPEGLRNAMTSRLTSLDFGPIWWWKANLTSPNVRNRVKASQRNAAGHTEQLADQWASLARASIDRARALRAEPAAGA